MANFAAEVGTFATTATTTETITETLSMSDTPIVVMLICHMGISDAVFRNEIFASWGWFDGSAQHMASINEQDGQSNPDPKRQHADNGPIIELHTAGTSDTTQVQINPNSLSAGQFAVDVDINGYPSAQVAWLAIGGSGVSVELQRWAFDSATYTTGNKTLTHSLGTTPTAAIMFTQNHYQENDAFMDAPVSMSIGFWDGTDEWTVTGYSADPGGNQQARQGSDQLLIKSFGGDAVINPNSTIQTWNEATITASDSTTLTINFTSISPKGSRPGSATGSDDFYFALLAGTNAKVLRGTTRTSNGTKDYTFPFKPKAILLTGVQKLAAGSTPVTGMCLLTAVISESFEQCHVVSSQDNVASSNTKTGWKTSAYWLTDPSNGSTLVEATLSSMADNGTVTLNFTTTDGNEYEFGMIAFEDPDVVPRLEAMKPLSNPWESRGPHRMVGYSAQ